MHLPERQKKQTRSKRKKISIENNFCASSLPIFDYLFSTTDTFVSAREKQKSRDLTKFWTILRDHRATFYLP